MLGGYNSKLPRWALKRESSSLPLISPPLPSALYLHTWGLSLALSLRTFPHRSVLLSLLSTYPSPILPPKILPSEEAFPWDWKLKSWSHLQWPQHSLGSSRGRWPHVAYAVSTPSSINTPTSLVGGTTCHPQGSWGTVTPSPHTATQQAGMTFSPSRDFES